MSDQPESIPQISDPDEPFSPQRLQREHRIWSLYNFGDGPAYQPLLGAIEEFGELLVAFDDDEEDEMEDALADCVVFLCDFASKTGIRFEEVWFPVEPLTSTGNHSESHSRALLKYLARICHHQLKREQKIRGDDAMHVEEIRKNLRRALERLEYIALRRRHRLIVLVEKTWEKVKKRDFKKNALTGGEQKGNA